MNIDAIECRHELSVKYADDSSCSPGRIDWCPECGAIAVNGEWTKPAIADELEAAQKDAKQTPEEMARKMHHIYEELAPKFGYETRSDTREFNPDSPNGKLMIAVCAAMKEKP